MWASAAHYKEIPSGASEPLVWDRCNYSDNIRESALPRLQSSLPGWRMLGSGWGGMQLPCAALHFYFYFSSPPCLPAVLFTLIFFSVHYFLPTRTHSHASPSRNNTRSYIHPHLALFVKQNLFHWDGNQMKGNHAVTVQLLIVPPSCTPPSLLTVSPEQDRCSVCMLPAYPNIHLPSRNS